MHEIAIRQNEPQRMVEAYLVSEPVRVLGHQMRDIAANSYRTLASIMFGFIPQKPEVLYDPISETDWHVMPLGLLPSYQLFNVMEVPSDALREFYSFKEPCFDQLLIGVETQHGESLKLSNSVAPRSYRSYSYNVEFNGYNFVGVEHDRRRDMEGRLIVNDLDPIIWGVKFARVRSNGNPFGALMEITRWQW
jgi:hypothetical protein